MFGSAPLDNNSSTTLICLLLAASISGVVIYNDKLRILNFKHIHVISLYILQ